MLLSLFLDYFIETAVSSGEGLDLYFGISVFKAMLSSLIFLAVKPLDSTFYLLLVLKCAQHLARGLGLKSLIWDAYCSRARWKKDFHTRLKQPKSLIAQFAVVARFNGKAVMVVLILLKILQLKCAMGPAAPMLFREARVTLMWVPPLTGRMHHLERISMLAGFSFRQRFISATKSLRPFFPTRWKSINTKFQR